MFALQGKTTDIGLLQTPNTVLEKVFSNTREELPVSVESSFIELAQ
jgi:hypothetical protein